MDIKDYSNIFTRYDLVTESPYYSIRKAANENRLIHKVIEAVILGETDRVPHAVKAALAEHDPVDIIYNGLVAAMREVSLLWDEGIYYLPQTLLASDAMLLGLKMCENELGHPVRKRGLAVTHTAEGDIHDLGQKIVNALLRANGFEVVDLGKDVPVDEVITAVKKYNPVMVTGTALMTTTMTAFEKISKRLVKEGYKIPFVCGGGAVSNEYVQGYELGVYGKDASQAPGMASDAVNGMDWMQIREKWNS